MENCKPTNDPETAQTEARRPPVVIVTRPEPDGSAFAQAVARAGLRPVLSPVMDIVFKAPGRCDASTAPADAERSAALAFTSANGVRAFAAQSADRGKPVFAVGDATARAAGAAGFENVRAAGGDVASLAELIAAAAPAGPVIHVAGSERAGDLAAALKAAGVEARREVLYSAVERQALSPDAAAAIAERTGPIVVALFSPRSAEIFLRQLARAAPDTDLPALRFACLSKAVAQRVERTDMRDRFGERAVEIAAATTADEMLRLVASPRN